MKYEIGYKTIRLVCLRRIRNSFDQSGCSRIEFGDKTCSEKNCQILKGKKKVPYYGECCDVIYNMLCYKHCEKCGKYLKKINPVKREEKE